MLVSMSGHGLDLDSYMNGLDLTSLLSSSHEERSKKSVEESFCVNKNVHGENGSRARETMCLRDGCACVRDE